MKETIKNALILFVIALIASIMLAFASQLTAEPIAIQKAKQRDEAFATVIPNATFEEVKGTDLTAYDKINAVYAAKADDKIIGYTFKMTTNEGYSAGLEMVVGLTVDGKISGIDVIKHSETPGLGAKADEPEFKAEFAGKTMAELKVVKGTASADNEIAAIGGSTITSKAVTGAVNQAIECYNNELKEGN